MPHVMRKAAEPLLAGRRPIDGMEHCRLLGEWTWFDAAKKWALPCELQAQAGALIPEVTKWFVVVDHDYPWGDIDIFPAKEGGLTRTYRHQLYNGLGDPKLPWRAGKLCVQTPIRILGRRGYDVEPYTADDRLLWHLERVRDWLEAAGSDRLAEDGDPFELPDFPLSDGPELAFLEDGDSFDFWKKSSTAVGVATTVRLSEANRWEAVGSFQDLDEHVVRRIEWGAYFDSGTLLRGLAIWLRLPAVPVLPPWQAPATFGELRALFRTHSLDFDELVAKVSSRFRDGKRHLLFVGFPLPATVGGTHRALHWQGLRLPAFSTGAIKGFRPTEQNHRENDRRRILSDCVRISWIRSRNWAESEIRTRGRASPTLVNSDILVLGCGAVGSCLSELLARQGCMRFTIVDKDVVEIGNLSRHTSSLREIGMPKAEAVAARVNTVSPHVEAIQVPQDFVSLTGLEAQLASKCGVVIDCTGDDRVAYQLSVFSWVGNKLFVSVSVGLFASRLFLFAFKGATFPLAAFRAVIGRWVAREREEYGGQRLPRDGIGCWHPVFPARCDDIWLLSCVAARRIDEWAESPPDSPSLCVYEQYRQNGVFAGVRHVAG